MSLYNINLSHLPKRSSPYPPTHPQFPFKIPNYLPYHLPPLPHTNTFNTLPIPPSIKSSPPPLSPPPLHTAAPTHPPTLYLSYKSKVVQAKHDDCVGWGRVVGAFFFLLLLLLAWPNISLLPRLDTPAALEVCVYIESIILYNY